MRLSLAGRTTRARSSSLSLSLSPPHVDAGLAAALPLVLAGSLIVGFFLLLFLLDFLLLLLGVATALHRGTPGTPQAQGERGA